MHTTTVTKALAIAGLTAAAGLSVLFAPSAANAASADGGQRVFARHGVIYLQDGARATRLTDDEVSAQPRLSPDGARIVYLHNSTVWVMGTDGTGQHQVSDRTGTAPAWTPDSTWITYTAESCTGAPGTFRVGTEGGTASAPVLPAACVDQATPQTGYIEG